MVTSFQGLGPVYTMDHEVGPWKMAFFHSNLGCRRTYTKITHVPKKIRLRAQNMETILDNLTINIIERPT
jgi:hypothetical protein